MSAQRIHGTIFLQQSSAYMLYYYHYQFLNLYKEITYDNTYITVDMAKIKQLPPHEAQKIAAGEVVERPANIVKKLAKNAIKILGKQ